MIDTDEIRRRWPASTYYADLGRMDIDPDVKALCDALDATRAALEAQRQLHANLLAHLRWGDGR